MERRRLRHPVPWPEDRAVDTAGRVWKAPAGRDATVVGLSGLASGATHADQDAMNRAGINVLRSFDGIGPVVWGARTLAGDDTLASDWKHLPVRRLALFIESSILRAPRGLPSSRTPSRSGVTFVTSLAPFSWASSVLARSRDGPPETPALSDARRNDVARMTSTPGGWWRRLASRR